MEQSNFPDTHQGDDAYFCGEKTESPLHILLVEDCSINAEVALEYLDLLGHRGVATHNGDEAIALLKQSVSRNDPFEMVLMDIEMPDMDGLAVTRLIRDGKAGDRNASLPIIAMTAHVLEEYRQKSRDAGMDDFLEKPVEIAALHRIIKERRPSVPEESNRIEDEEDQSLPVLDEEEGLRLFAGNPELLKKIYAIFLSETPAQVEALQIAIQKRDMEGVRFTAHTLKGATARIAASQARQSCQHLEATAKDGDSDRISELASSALFEINKVIERLEQKVDNE